MGWRDDYSVEIGHVRLLQAHKKVIRPMLDKFEAAEAPILRINDVDICHFLDSKACELRDPGSDRGWHDWKRPARFFPTTWCLGTTTIAPCRHFGQIYSSAAHSFRWLDPVIIFDSIRPLGFDRLPSTTQSTFKDRHSQL